MIKNLVEMFKNSDIRNRILFTLAMLFIFRLGSAIPAPGVDISALSAGIADNTLINMMNLLGGGSFQQMSVFALGVGPYITASIVIQLLSMDIIPALTELTKSGHHGRQKIDRITRYLTVILAFVQAFTLSQVFGSETMPILENPSIAGYLFVSTILTAGTMFLLWIGDRITQFGIGNGISMIIFAGIVSSLPNQFMQVYSILVAGAEGSAMVNGMLLFALYVVMYLAIIVLVVFMQKAVRKIPIQYTSSAQVRNRKDISFLPLKVNSAGVIPVIFASALLQAPQILLSFFPTNGILSTIKTVFDLQTVWGITIYGILIVLFTFFYVNLQVDPNKIAENLNKSGTYVPGIRPGKDTEGYLYKVINRITVLGAFFLLIIALIPYILPMVTTLPNTVALGGTGIIIVVGVALDTTTQLRSQLSQKEYKGFVNK